jgi:hypothetical protein
MTALDYINQYEPWLLALSRNPTQLPFQMQAEARPRAEALGITGVPDPTSGLLVFPKEVWFATFL